MASCLTYIYVTAASDFQNVNFSFNMSNTLYFTVIICVNLDLLVRFHHHTWFTLLIILLSAGFFFVANVGFITQMRNGRYQLNYDFDIWFGIESGLFVGLAILTNVLFYFVVQATYGVFARLINAYYQMPVLENKKEKTEDEMTKSRKMMIDALSKKQV